MVDDEIALADAMHELRSELDRAIRRAADERLEFEALEVTMEFTVGVTRSDDVRGAVELVTTGTSGCSAPADNFSET